MPSYAPEIKSTFLAQLETVRRPAQIYTVATTTIFTISGGPVWIWGLYGVFVAAMATASTARHQINGRVLDAGAVNINSGVDDVVIFPLDSSGTGVVVPNVAASCMPGIGALNAGGGKVMASVTPGTIALTIAAFVTTAAFDMYCSYYRMTENSLITVT